MNEEKVVQMTDYRGTAAQMSAAYNLMAKEVKIVASNLFPIQYLMVDGQEVFIMFVWYKE